MNPANAVLFELISIEREFVFFLVHMHEINSTLELYNSRLGLPRHN